MTQVMLEVIAEITTIARLCPSLRFCQLVSNVVPEEVAERNQNDLYYITDLELLRYLKDYRKMVEEVKGELKCS